MTRSIVAASAILIGGCAQILELPDDPKLISGSACSASAAPLPQFAHVRVHVCDWASPHCSAPVTGVAAQLCDFQDVDCQHPLLDRILDRDGVLEFDVPTARRDGAGFAGYLRLSSACEDTATCASSVQPTQLFFNPPIIRDTELSFPVAPAGFLTLLKENGIESDASHGVALIMALDCAGRSRPGVSYQLTPAPSRPVPLYFEHGVLSQSAVVTDRTGIGGFASIPQGFVTVEVASAIASSPYATVGVHVSSSYVTISTVVISE
jgi:hypothetical protein